MSLFIASLNSGSNGNCYYIGNRHEAVLVDCGISCREIDKRMKRLKLDMAKVKAIFVSHEHTDHISGIATLCKKYQLPVYITPGTISDSGLVISPNLITPFCAGEAVAIGGLFVTPFSKYHDAGDPHSFIVQGSGVTVGIFTDLGRCCDQLVHYFKQCNAAFLESNYDVQMLETGKYPYYLKRRISGGMGHLSNAEALNLFVTHRPAHMSLLLLAHLSKNNNTPQLALNLFQKHAGNTHVAIAPRHEETRVYEIKNSKVIVNDFISTIRSVGLQMKMF